MFAFFPLPLNISSDLFYYRSFGFSATLHYWYVSSFLCPHPYPTMRTCMCVSLPLASCWSKFRKLNFRSFYGSIFSCCWCRFCCYFISTGILWRSPIPNRRSQPKWQQAATPPCNESARGMWHVSSTMEYTTRQGQHIDAARTINVNRFSKMLPSGLRTECFVPVWEVCSFTCVCVSVYFQVLKNSPSASSVKEHVCIYDYLDSWLEDQKALISTATFYN